MFNHQFLAQISLGLSLSLALTSPVRSQITPNGAGTLVNHQSNQINISGGTQAGANLFHSFRDFNLTSAQIANFLSNPQTQNILARINGGNPSLINGLLQVTGGNSNLFLMNPSGIVFGQGASLNVPASFTVTTANQIELGNNQYFSATGNNNYAALTGTPDSFLFTTAQAGSIVNAGNLTVGSGQSISLIAGNTINTGRLTAPGGEIQVLALAGNRVRISQPGQVLSLEIVPPVDGTLKAVDLPALLTGSGELPGIAVNPSGQVEVAGTSLPNQQGIAVASGRIDVSSATGNGGMVQVLGDGVAVLNSRINANGATGGGIVRLGGEYLGGIDTGIAPALRFNSQRTIVDRGSLIRANATTTGDGGRVIVWADQNTGYFGRITGRGATGRGGFVEVSGKENLAFDGTVELPGFNGLGGTLLLDPTNITIVAGANNSQVDDAQVNVDATILSGDTPVNMTISAGALAAIAGTTAINITAIGNIDFQSNVIFTAGTPGAGNIAFNAATISSSGAFTLNTRGRNLTITADSINASNLNLNTSPLAANASGNIQVTANSGNLVLGALVTSNNNNNGGSVTLNALQGSITTTNINTQTTTGNGGTLAFTAPQGNITTGSISTYANSTGNGGAINFNAQGNITTGNVIYTYAVGAGAGTGNGGAINLNTQGNITTGGIFTYAGGTGTGNGGNVTFTTTQGNITNDFIYAPANIGNGGAINLNSQGNIINSASLYTIANIGNAGIINLNSQGNITTSNIYSYAFTTGNGGAINLNAPSGNIVTDSISSLSLGAGLGNTSGAININAGNLVRVIGANGGICATGVSLCSSGVNGATNGAVTIRHGGSTTTPFIIGNSTTNGTAGSIDAGTGNTISTPTTIPVPPNTYTQGLIQIITTTPPVVTDPSSTISPELLTLLRNPAPPPTPAPVIVGIPSDTTTSDTTTIEVIPSLDPVVVPIVVSSPVLVNNPVFTPNPTPLNLTPPAVPSPVAVIPSNSPTPLPLALASPLGIARPGNLESTSPGVQPVPSNTQNCVVRSPYQGGISWVLQPIWGQQVCARETVSAECCNPRTNE